MNSFEWNGLTIVIEYNEGDIRFGRYWSCKYGYIEDYLGEDGVELDCYVGDNLDSPNLFLLQQVRLDGTPDESKVMIGFNDIDEAKQAYIRCMPVRFFGGIKPISFDSLEYFQNKIYTTTQPVRFIIDYTVPNTIEGIDAYFADPFCKELTQAQIAAIADSPAMYECYSNTVFIDKAIHAKAVAKAKNKFDVWPSAYGSLYMTKLYKSMGGRFRAEKNSTNALSNTTISWSSGWQVLSNKGEVLEVKDNTTRPKCLSYDTWKASISPEILSAYTTKYEVQSNTVELKTRAEKYSSLSEELLSMFNLSDGEDDDADLLEDYIHHNCTDYTYDQLAEMQDEDHILNTLMELYGTEYNDSEIEGLEEELSANYYIPSKYKDKESGGLTNKGISYSNRKFGTKLKAGVQHKPRSPEEFRRQGLFLTRMYGPNSHGPLTNADGTPTRRALQAKKWNSKIPKTAEDVRVLYKKGKRLLETYSRLKDK